MKISCSTTIGHRLSLDEALDRIADLGFAEIDLLAAHGWAHVSPRDLVDDFAATSAAIRTSLESRGLGIAALNVAFSGPLYGRSEDDVARRHDEGLAVVNLMEAFDVDVAAVQPGGRPHGIADTTLIEDAAASWAELTALAAEKSRTLALELHTRSPFDSPTYAAPSSRRCSSGIRRFRHPPIALGHSRLAALARSPSAAASAGL